MSTLLKQGLNSAGQIRGFCYSLRLVRRKSGHHLVELCLVLVPLLVILSGICQYGFMYAAAITVRNASDAAARYAVLYTGTNALTKAQIQAVADSALTP